MHTTQKLGQAS